MEFEFRKDFITDLATVQTEMNHEAFATWLEMEGQTVDWVESLLEKLMLLQQKTVKEYRLAGKEFDLLLSDSEAQVIHHRLLESASEDEISEELSFYDAEVEANCGLEDFINLIESWLVFIR